MSNLLESTMHLIHLCIVENTRIYAPSLAQVTILKNLIKLKEQGKDVPLMLQIQKQN